MGTSAGRSRRVIEMTVVCRSCGVEWEPTRQDFTRGDWRECPRCRHGPDTTPDPQTHESTHHGAPEPSERTP